MSRTSKPEEYSSPFTSPSKNLPAPSSTESVDEKIRGLGPMGYRNHNLPGKLPSVLLMNPTYEKRFKIRDKISSMFSQPHVKQFIADEVLGRNFNEYPYSGAHTTFVNRAAKASGLTVRKIDDGHYFFEDHRVVGSVEAMVTSLISSAAVKIGWSKIVMKELFRAVNVPVADGQVFQKNQRAKGLRFFESLAAFGVVKPDHGRGGNGITAGIQNTDDFRLAWTKALKHARGRGRIVVEEYVPGLDLRVYVVGNRAVAATTRIPPYVVGDGHSNIATLLDQKRAQRELNGYLRRMPIVADEHWMANSDLEMTTVLPPNEIAVLNSTSNLTQGGENVDVTGILSDDLADIAVRALRAIPGMGAGGVDFQARSPRTSDGAVLLEINTVANISMHHMPAYGVPVDVGQSLVDAMLSQ